MGTTANGYAASEIWMNSLTSGKALLVIDDERCQACRLCHAKRVCKVKAIVRIDDDETPFIDIHRCHGCMLCVVECPFAAIASA
jgi:MinD superfamily P-loop ATPase